MTGMFIAINQIVFDAGTQVRECINEHLVEHYAERMTAGDRFPPIALFHDGNRYYLADGFHRALAAKRNGLVDIPAEVTAGTVTDALWFALGANKANAQHMSSADKRHAILLALKAWPDRSQKSLAEQIGVSQQWFSDVASKVRRDNQDTGTGNLPDRVTGKDGKSYPASRPTEPKRHPKYDDIAASLKAGESVQAVATKHNVRTTVVTSVRKNEGLEFVDKSREATAQRRRDIASLAERGYTSRQIAAEVGLDERTVKSITQSNGIYVHADRAVGKLRRHDPNRIVAQMVSDAENLTADVNLIDFKSLDRAQLAEWIESLNKSRRSLSSFITRLTEEQKKHGEAA